MLTVCICVCVCVFVCMCVCVCVHAYILCVGAARAKVFQCARVIKIQGVSRVFVAGFEFICSRTKNYFPMIMNIHKEETPLITRGN